MNRNLVPFRGVNLTTLQRNGLTSPEESSLIYNADLKVYQQYNGLIWEKVGQDSLSSLSDTPSGYGDVDSIPVVNPGQDGIVYESVVQLARRSVLSSRYHQHAISAGADVHIPINESTAPYVCALGSPASNLVANDSGTVTETVSNVTSLTPGSTVQATEFGTRVNRHYEIDAVISQVSTAMTLSVPVNLPASQLAEDFTDRILFDLDGLATIAIRNGKVSYRQGTQVYHPTVLTADVNYTITFTRDSLGAMKLTLNESPLELTGFTLTDEISKLGFMSSLTGTSPLLGKTQSLAIWSRELTAKEVTNNHLVLQNASLLDAYAAEYSFSTLTDGFDYTITDANKALVINATGTGLEPHALDYVPATQLIQDGLKGYISGAVPNFSICAMQIQNKTLTLPVNQTVSKVYALTAPVNTISFDIIKYANGAYDTEILIGTISFAAGSKLGVSTVPVATTFIAGDMLAIRSPNGVEGTRDLFINLVGSGPLPYFI